MATLLSSGITQPESEFLTFQIRMCRLKLLGMTLILQTTARTITDAGEFTCFLQERSLHLTDKPVPDGFELSQNYPNPFNPSTSIGFEIPSNSEVSLKVYNMQGKEVADLVNDRRDAGRYEVNFDAAKYGLSSGTYIYAIKAGNFSQSKKMTIVK